MIHQGLVVQSCRRQFNVCNLSASGVGERHMIGRRRKAIEEEGESLAVPLFFFPPRRDFFLTYKRIASPTLDTYQWNRS